MRFETWLPVLILASSLVTGLITFFLREEQALLRGWLNMLGAGLKVVLVGWLMWGVLERGLDYETRFSIGLGFDILLRVDLLSLLLVALSTVLWFATTAYAIGYLRGYRRLNRFFGFFSICVTASVGVALAGNLFTFFIFYEFLTLSTYPLVVHTGTPTVMRAGRTYLAYTLTGGTLLLIGAVGVNVLTGPTDFTPGGVMAGFIEGNTFALRVLFVVLIAGLGVKAALVPLHGWLPIAMVAPAPVSALLHAVAVVKAGAFGIVRVVHDVYGIGTASELGVLPPLMALASVTIIYGSLRALRQMEIKRMLAYSTVSQVSYITLGAAMFGVTATIGSLVHLIHQGLMKVTLFFCAGIMEKHYGLTRIADVDGIARRLPLTTAAFTLAALGMIGVPPIAGFVSKWYLGLGGLEVGASWVIAVLLVSSLLNAMYFLPVIYAAYFRDEKAPRTAKVEGGRLEAAGLLLWPTLATAALSLAAGVMAAGGFSPLALARRIAELLYRTV
jgi:multicomponent Na+:H+ antiporter subunit D